MENVSDYIGVFTQAPLAVILMVFIYLTNKQQNNLIAKQSEMINELIKVLKQDKRKEE